MLNWIIKITQQYLWPFNDVQMNEWCEIELLVSKSNTRNH